MIQSSMVGQRVYFASTSTLQFIIKGRPGREGHGQETGGSSSAGAETTRGTSSWLASRLTFSYLSYTAQPHLPRNGTAHSGLVPNVPVSTQENAHPPPPPPHAHKASLVEVLLQVRFPLLRCAKLMIKMLAITSPK